MNKIIRFGICGFGQIGKRHAAEIHAHEHGQLACVVDIDPEACLKAKEMYNVPAFTNLADAMDSGIRPDIYVVATPNCFHQPQARFLIGNEMNVLVEKPIGLKRKECEELLFMAIAKRKQIFCVLQNRYSPPSKLLKELVSSGALGQIYWVEVNCYWNRDERYYTDGSWRGTATYDGGTLYTQFSHFVDLVYWVFGPMLNMQGRFYNFNHQDSIEFEDTGIINFELESGGAGIFSYSTSLWDKNMESSITVIGEKGSLKIGGQYMEKIEYYNVKDLTQPELTPTNAPNDYGSYKGSANNHALVIDNVIKALRGEEYEMALAEEAVASVGIIEEIYKLRDSMISKKGPF